MKFIDTIKKSEFEKLSGKSDNEKISNKLFLGLYPKFFIDDDIEILSTLLNDREASKFNGYEEVEQYMAIYIYVKNLFVRKSKNYK